MSTLDEILQGFGEEEAPELSFDERVKLTIEKSQRRLGDDPSFEDVTFEMVRSKADVFDFIVELLVTHKPNLLDEEGEEITGGELILAEIRRLQVLENLMNSNMEEGDRAH